MSVRFVEQTSTKAIAPTVRYNIEKVTIGFFWVWTSDFVGEVPWNYFRS